MAKKQKTNNKNLYLLFGVFLFIIILFAIFLKKQSIPQHSKTQQSYPTITPTINTYHSKFLKARIDVPDAFSIEERFGQVTIKKGDRIIILHWVGTNKNYNNLNEFIDDTLDNYEKNVKREKLIIDTYDAESVEVIYPNNHSDNNKAYYIFINGSFYHLYTSSPELYPYLDQIAQSFRYQP